MPKEKKRIDKEILLCELERVGDAWFEPYIPQRGRRSELQKTLDPLCRLVREGFPREYLKIFGDKKFSEVSIKLRLTKYKGSRKKRRRFLRPITEHDE